jgi:MBOAT, membrane-bound O-acyltransferase family
MVETLARHNKQEENDNERDNGWYNLLSIVTLLSILRHIVTNFQQYGLVMEIPLSRIYLKDSLWVFLVILLNFVRSCVIFKVRDSLFFSFFALLNTEIFIFFIIFMNVEYAYLCAWCYIITIAVDLKLVSYLIENRDTIKNTTSAVRKDNDINDSTYNTILNNSENCEANVLEDNEDSKSFNFKQADNQIKTATASADYQINDSNHLKSTLPVEDTQYTKEYLLAISKDLRNFLYFMIIPVLVYKKEYKMKKEASKKRIAKKSLEFIFYLFLFVFIMDQYSITSIYKIVDSPNLFEVLDNGLSFIISTIFLFNIFFKICFNCAFEILSEITKFDELTYEKWWNSKSAADFWERWNLPVHQFIKHHIYKPLLKKGISKDISTGTCFLLSGAIHELVIALTMKSISGMFFLAMLAQLPLIYVSSIVKKKYPRQANMFFWLSFCVIGQPLMVLLIYRSIYLKPQ